MADFRSHGTFGLGERQIFSLAVKSHAEILGSIEIPTPRFICFIAADSNDLSDQEIRSLSTGLIGKGCSYLCVWGQECERFHDQFDLADFELHPDGPWSMSTWHSKESLPSALWYALEVAWPDPSFEDSPHSLVAISIGSDRWAASISSALADGGNFPRRAGFKVGTILSKLACQFDLISK
jgi:hypothetical protein